MNKKSIKIKLNINDYFKFEDSDIIYQCFKVNKPKEMRYAAIRNLRGYYNGCISRDFSPGNRQILSKKEVIEACEKKYTPTIIPAAATIENILPESLKKLKKKLDEQERNNEKNNSC